RALFHERDPALPRPGDPRITASLKPQSSVSAEGAGICSATKRDKFLLIVDDFDIDNSRRPSRAPDACDRGESIANRRSQIIDPEIHGWHSAADSHADGEVTGDVDERRNWAPVELSSARSTLEFWPHGHSDRNLLALMVK